MALDDSPARFQVISSDDLINELVRRPVSVDKAMSTLSDTAGIYAWWADRHSIPGVPPCPHPDDDSLHLFYVGIAPARPTSSATLRSRIVGNHLSGNTGASTFRFTLAALLMEDLRFTPQQTKTKVVLPREQNRRLSNWQKDHLHLTWAEVDQPWLVESEVIERLKPPLNLASNSAHPFHARVTSARARFRAAAQ